ncbi:hypothetical protein AMJ86_02960 [bacterium SM23_57]|jgi:hypothetical protein|nr:MAG: hypothetical protein AMJ86_02960 [bacterium SM23_57]
MVFSTYNEQPLHAALKEWYARPGDRLEAKVDGYIIDILQDQKLVEIQTRNFAAIKTKITDLTKRHQIRVVHPIAKEKWILKLPLNGVGSPQRRKSPKRGCVTEVFKELVSFPELMKSPNFSLEVLMIQEEEIRAYIGKSRWRNRGWAIKERRLLGVLESHTFTEPKNLLELIPSGLPDRFTTRELAEVMGESRRFAQSVAYCARKMGTIQQIGKHGRSHLYAFTKIP